jgi:hypothetical protein
MTLSDLTLPISYNDSQQLALVFSPPLAQCLAELHAQYGSNNLVPEPIMLTDGRLMLCGDILTEVTNGGLLHNMWLAAKEQNLLQDIEVIPWEEAVSLIIPTNIDTIN